MQISINTFLFFIVSFLAVWVCSGQNSTHFESVLEKGNQYEVQKKYNDALQLYKKELAEISLTKKEALLLSKIAGVYYKLKKYGQSEEYYLKAINRDSSINLSVKNYIGLSYCLRKKNIKDSALYYLDIANALKKKMPNSFNKANAEYKMGFIYKDYDLIKKSLPLYLSAYDGFKLFKDKKNLANVCNAIAVIQRKQGNEEKSIEYYHKGRLLREELNDYKGLSLAYNNLANGHKSLLKLDSALYYYQKSLNIKKQRGYTNQGFTLHNIGTVYYMKGDLYNAKKFYKKALNKKRIENDTLTLVYSYNELALLAIEENDFESSKKYLDSARIDISGNNELSLRWNELQKIHFYKQNDFFSAYKYQQAYIEIYKSLYNQSKAKIIIDNQDEFDTAKKVETIEDLTLENDKTTKLLTRRTFYLISVITFLVLMIIGYIINRQQQRLQAQKKDIENLRALYQSQDSVRNTIGRDLHDIVKARYEGIRLMIISLARSNNIKQDVKEVTREIVKANSQVRTLSHRLSPLDQRIEHSKFNQIIRAELNKFQLYCHIKIILTDDFPEQWNEMSLEMMNHLYGIFLEAINNVKEHSEASEIIIEPILHGNMSQVSISDNGINKQKEFKEGIGIGIGNIKSRAKLMQGNATIKNSVNGFSVIVKFPINENL